jgi:hypothetical protein
LVNLREGYTHFSELEEACAQFCAEVNAREHRDTRARPDERLATERARLHPVPAQPFTACFGETRRVGRDSTVSVGAVRYSVPHPLVEEQVWVRFHGDDLIVTAIRDGAAVEVARHRRSTPGNPVIRDEHYPPSSRGERTPKPTNPAEAEFLAVGPGAAAWLTEAAAVGAHRIRVKMAEAVVMAKLHGRDPVDRALGTAAIAGRFGEGDLLAILMHQTEAHGRQHVRPSETHSLQPGTSAWAAFGNDGRPTP